MKTALIDASSAILLFKARGLRDLVEQVRTIMARSVFSEITVTGYPGAEHVIDLKRQGRIHVCESPAPAMEPEARPALGRGESDTLRLFPEYPDAYIILDDKKGAGWCRKQQIPYINALLVPKILYLSQKMTRDRFCLLTERISNLGRYSDKILTYAHTCRADDLSFFLPSKVTCHE